MAESRSNQWKWFCIIFGTILITRSTTFLQPLIDDEEAFAAFARVLMQGGIPYVSVIDNKPPLLYYLYAACLWLFGNTSTVGIHLLGVFWVTAICWYLFKIGRRVSDAQSGYFSALLFAVFSSCFIPPTIAVHASLLIALPLTMSVWCLIKWFDDKKVIWMLASGLLCGIAVFMKYQALIQIPLVIWALLYLHFRNLTDNWGRTILASIVFGLGILLLCIPILLWMNHIGALSAMLDHTLRASVSYMKDGEGVGDFWMRALTQVGTYTAATLPLWLGLGHQLTHRVKHYLNAEPVARPLQTWIWGWFFFTIPAILAGGRFYGHYFIQILPPMCLIASISFVQWWQQSTRSRIIISATLIIFALGWMAPRIWYQEWADRFNLQNLKVEIKIADYLKLKMGPNDTLFIWGTEPGLYFLSERSPATRFLWVDSLIGRLPGIPETQKGAMNTSTYTNPKSWEMFWQDIEKTKPLYFVDCATGNLRDYAKFPITNYPELHNYVTRHYKLETTIDGVTIYRRTTP